MYELLAESDHCFANGIIQPNSLLARSGFTHMVSQPITLPSEQDVLWDVSEEFHLDEHINQYHSFLEATNETITVIGLPSAGRALRPVVYFAKRLARKALSSASLGKAFP